MTSLIKLDFRLLVELESDARQTLSQIAKKLKTSQQVVSYRMKSLEKREVIGGYYTILDLSKLGYTSYRTMIRFSNITTQKYKEIIKYLVNHTNVLWIVECGGRWDLIVNFIAKNVIQYNNFLIKFRKKFPSQIQNYDILPTANAVYFGRDYFVKDKRAPQDMPSFGGESREIHLDNLNLKILKFLSRNARMSAVNMATKLKTSSNTIMLRVKEMKKKGIIQGFKPVIHLENVGYFGYKSLIKLQNVTEQKEKEIVDYLKSKINVVGIIRLIGAWDFEIEFEVKTNREMLEFNREFRDSFKNIIKEFETIPLFHEYKYDFFPGDILLQNKNI